VVPHSIVIGQACCSLHWLIIINISCHIFLVVYLIIQIFKMDFMNYFSFLQVFALL